jgi:hypothetical protein
MNLLSRSLPAPLVALLGLLLLASSTFLAVETNAFVVVQQRSVLLSSSSSTKSTTRQFHPLYMAEEEDKLRALGYSEDEIRRTEEKAKSDNEEDISVNVNLLPDVDPTTLTAIGFGLIALNFFVFANMGDGGIAGVIATIANNW